MTAGSKQLLDRHPAETGDPIWSGAENPEA
jgi:hypothetical protein